MWRRCSILGFTTVVLLVAASPLAGDDLFMRGNANGDGAVDIADAIYTLCFLFGPADDPCNEPRCLDALDANDSGAIDIADAVYVLGYLFARAPAPPAPFPGVGSDPTPDDLTCGGGGPSEPKPPEALIRFDPDAVDIAVGGIDNADPEPLVTRTGGKARAVFSIVDRAGNSLGLDVEITRGTAPTDWVEAAVVELRYRGEAPLVPPQNRYRAEFVRDGQTGALTSLRTTIEVEGAFSVHTEFAAQEERTGVSVTLSGQARSVEYSFAGLYLIDLMTDDGAFGLIADRGSYPEGGVDWSAVLAGSGSREKGLLQPGFFDTSEYMTGSVAVGVILMESNGAASTEDWTPQLRTDIRNQLTAALTWWEGMHPSGALSFVIDWTYWQQPIATQYEPISLPQSQDRLWINDALQVLGKTNRTVYTDNIREYANDLRGNLGTDWAFVLFVANSANDGDGCFSDQFSAYARFLGGPYAVITYDCGAWGISRAQNIIAHETGHIFYACDEYVGNPLHSPNTFTGYLNVGNGNCWTAHNCIMNDVTFRICTSVRDQIGWRDQDGDGILDIFDTLPSAALTPFVPDPTPGPFVTFRGTARVTPRANENPIDPGTSTTLTTIAAIEHRVDGGTWSRGGTADDGSFDNHTEDYSFTVFLSGNNAVHTVEVRAVDSAGNVGTSASDTLTVSGASSGDTRLTVSSPPASTTLQNWSGEMASSGSYVHVVWLEGVFTSQAGGLYNLYTVKYMRSIDAGRHWDDGLGNAGWTRNLAFYGTSNGVGRPRIAAEGSDLHVVWVGDAGAGTDSRLYYLRGTDNGHNWGAPVQPMAPPAGAQVFQGDVATSGDAVYVAYCLATPLPPPQQMQYVHAVHFVKSTNRGASWPTPAVKLSGDYPSMGWPFAAAAGNCVHVVWNDNRTGKSEVFYKGSTDGGATWGADVGVAVGAVAAWAPNLAVEGTNVHVVWADSPAGNNELYHARSLDSGMTWSATTRLTQDASADRQPAIVAAGGSVHITWFADRPVVGSLGIHYLRSADGGTTWSPDVPFATFATGKPQWPSLVGVAGGSVQVIWEDARHTGVTELYHRYFPD